MTNQVTGERKIGLAWLGHSNLINERERKRTGRWAPMLTYKSMCVVTYTKHIGHRNLFHAPTPHTRGEKVALFC